MAYRTPMRTIRIDDQLWDEFGAAADALGTDRTKVLVGFIRRLVAAMDPAALIRSTDTDPRPTVPPSAP